MSAGPIRAEREAFGRREPVSTTAKDRICASGKGLHATVGKAYCGRSSAPMVDDLSKVRCADCLAALRADGVIADG